MCRYIHGPPFQGSRSTPHSSDTREGDIERDDTPREGAQTMGCVSIYIHIAAGVTKQKRGRIQPGGRPAYTASYVTTIHGQVRARYVGVGRPQRIRACAGWSAVAEQQEQVFAHAGTRASRVSRVSSRVGGPESIRVAEGAITSRWCARWYACAGARDGCIRSSGARASSSGTCAREKTSSATVISPTRN